MLKLTARQEEILNLIKNAIENTGFPPTRAEIAKELGFRSANAAEEHLQALARKGVIDIAPGISRGIRLRQQETDQKWEKSRNSHRETMLTLDSYHHAAMHLNLPLIGRVAAGSPILAQEHIETTYQVDGALFPEKPDYLLKVRGLSMRDAGILEGDLLAVKKVSAAKNGQIVIARLGDEVTVKRYQQSGGVIELLPENPDFKTIRVDAKHDDFFLEGLAVGLLRTWT